MKSIQKKGWPIWGMILLILLLNIIIIKASKNSQYLLWVLIVSIPLLIMAIYSMRQMNRFLKCFINRSSPVAQQTHFELLSHSGYPVKMSQDDLQVSIGNDQCSKPYNACLLSIGVMENSGHKWSFLQALSNNISENGGFVKQGLTTYNLAAEAPVWQIGPTYQGCRTENGNLDSQAFKKIACMPDVKMIEIRLTSLDNFDYDADSTLAIENPNGTAIQHNIFPDSGYTAFRDAEGLVHFIESLRKLSSGKPVGIRLSISDKKEFHQICLAIRKTEIIPDFIVILGSSERAGFSHSGLLFCSEKPLYEALLFVSQTLQAYELDKKINVIAAGKIISGFDILKLLALGANSVCAEITDLNSREYASIHETKSPYWANELHGRLMKDMAQIMKVGGFRSHKDVTLSKFLRRLDVLYSERYGQPGDHVLYAGMFGSIACTF